MNLVVEGGNARSLAMEAIQEAKKGNFEEAAKMQIEYSDLCNALFMEVNPIPVKEAMKGVAIAEPEVKEHDVDLLIVGGGMGACGTAFEAGRQTRSENDAVRQGRP